MDSREELKNKLQSPTLFSWTVLGFKPTRYQADLLETEKNSIVLWSRQCVAENEYVYGLDGVILAGDIQEGTETYSGTATNVQKYEDDIYEVGFSNGVKVKVSGAHPLWVRTAGGDWGWREVETLVDGKWRGFFTDSIKCGTKRITYDIAKLVGYLLSDGSGVGKQSVKFTNNNVTFLDDVEEITKRRFGLVNCHRTSKNNGWDLHLVNGNGNKPNALKVYLKGLGCWEKETLGQVLQWDQNGLKGFLSGYFNGDGCLSFHRKKERIDYEVSLAVGTSKRIAVELQYLLWKLGVQSYVKEEWMKKSSRAFYRLMVAGDFRKKFLALVEPTKYPDKFNDAMKQMGKRWSNSVLRRDGGYEVRITHIRKLRRGMVVAYSTTTKEIIMASGLKTHNSGKTSTLAIKALHTALMRKNQEVLIIAPTQRQAKIMFDKIYDFCENNKFVKEHTRRLTISDLEFDSGSRIHCLPAGREGTSIRGFAATMIIFDEAAFIPDAVFLSVRPSMAVRGEQVVLSGTPFGKQGYFYNQYRMNELKKAASRDWEVFKVKATDSPFIEPGFLEEMRRTMTADQYAQEFEAEFIMDTNAFFPHSTVIMAMDDYQYALPDTKKLPAQSHLVMGVDIARAGCFDGETEILTKEGWKRFTDVQIGMHVLSMNPDTREAAYCPVAARQEYDYKGDMYWNEGQQTSLFVTPNHKMIRETKEKGKAVFEWRQNLKSSGYLPRAFVWHGTVPDKWVGFGESLKFDIEDWLKFLGWFVSIGLVRKSRDDIRAGFIQHSEVKKEEIKELLSRMGLGFEEKGSSLGLTDKLVSGWLETNCYSNGSKCAPNMLKQLPPDFIERFLVAFARGDRHAQTPERGINYYTSSKQLADDLQELSFKAGHTISLTERNANGSQAKLYTLHQFGKNERIDCGEFNKAGRVVPFEGKVYDVTVYPFHTLFVRRHGKAMWTGNSDETAIAICSVTSDNQYKVEWTEQHSKNLITETAGRVVELAGQYPDMTIYMDESGLGAGALDIVKEKNVNAIGVTFSVATRNRMYSNLKMALEQRRVRFSSDDRKMASQFTNYSGKQTSDGSYRIVKGATGHDDTVDALALCFSGEQDLEWIEFGEGIQLNPVKRMAGQPGFTWSIGE